MSKFEYSPSSFIVYTTENKTEGQNDPGIRYIIGTHSHTLFIVQDAHIRWAAHIDAVPIQIEVCTIQ